MKNNRILRLAFLALVAMCMISCAAVAEEVIAVEEEAAEGGV